MSSSAASSKKERYITRRELDKDGNVVIRRIKKRESLLSQLDLSWHRYLGIFLGSFLGVYAYFANLFGKGELANREGFAGSMNNFFSSFSGASSFWLVGTFAVGISVALGWLLVTRGFYVKTWPKGFRQLVAIVFVVLLFSAVFSGIINERGFIRHEDEVSDINKVFDVSALSAPFNLLGNIEPEATIATIELQGGGTLNSVTDTYLWRWYTPETYDINEENLFRKGFDNYRATFNGVTDSTIQNGILPNETTPEFKRFRVSQQFIALSNGYTGDAISSWNSVYGAPMNLDNPQVNGDPNLQKASAYLDMNQQPIVSATLDRSETSGFFEYDDYWISEFKTELSQNSMNLTELQNIMSSDAISSLNDASKFGDISSVDTFSNIWGLDSIGGSSYINNNQDFFDKYNLYNSAFNDTDATVYGAVLSISQEIQAELLNAFQTDPTAFTGSADSGGLSLADPGIDPGQFFWSAVANDQSFGLLDLIAGFNSMLRAFNIPARPVLGFSVGNIEGSTITLKGEHLTMWIEALIPWRDLNGDIQLSWGIFNLIPNINIFLSSGLLIYGRNSLNSAAEMLMEFETGRQTQLPDDIGQINGETDFIIANHNQWLNFSAAVLFEGEASQGQPISFRLLNESAILSLETELNPNVGWDLGTIVSDSDGYANMSIFAGSNQTTFISYEDGPSSIDDRMDLSALFNPLAAEGNRNVYALVATFGISFTFKIVAWSLQGNITLTSLNLEESTISDLGFFGGQETPASFAIPGETIQLQANFVDNDNNPITGQIIDLYLISSDEVNAITDALQNGDTSGIGTPVATFNATDLNGNSTTSYTIDSNLVIIGNYYTLLALPQGGLAFGEYHIHISSDLTIASIAQYGGDQLIYLDQTRQIPIDITSTITDNVLNIVSLGSVTPRSANGLPLSFFIMEKNVFEANNNTPNMITLLDSSISCTETLSVSSNCYKLSVAGFISDQFGIQSNINSSEGLTAIIQLRGSVVDLGSYYIIIYSETYQIYGTTARFGFFPGNQPMPLQLNSLEYQNNHFEKAADSNNPTVSIFMFSLALLVFLTRFKKEVF